MTDALHRCANCGIADERVIPINHPNGFESIFLHTNEQGRPSLLVCIDALKHQLAARDALIERCRPYVDAPLKYKQHPPTDLLVIEATALLADIDGRK